jgi:hypothetical protein
VLAGLEPAAVEVLLAQLLTLKANLRNAIAAQAAAQVGAHANDAAMERSHG